MVNLYSNNTTSTSNNYTKQEIKEVPKVKNHEKVEEVSTKDKVKEVDKTSLVYRKELEKLSEKIHESGIYTKEASVVLAQNILKGSFETKA